jgi:hypothetical protein
VERPDTIADPQQPSLSRARSIRAEITAVYVIEILPAVDDSVAPVGFYTAQARLVNGAAIVNVYVPESVPVTYGALVDVRVDEGRYFLERLLEER